MNFSWKLNNQIENLFHHFNTEIHETLCLSFDAHWGKSMIYWTF